MRSSPPPRIRGSYSRPAHLAFQFDVSPAWGIPSEHEVLLFRQMGKLRPTSPVVYSLAVTEQRWESRSWHLCHLSQGLEKDKLASNSAPSQFTSCILAKLIIQPKSQTSWLQNRVVPLPRSSGHYGTKWDTLWEMLSQSHARSEYLVHDNYIPGGSHAKV